MRTDQIFAQTTAEFRARFPSPQLSNKRTRDVPPDCELQGEVQSESGLVQFYRRPEDALVIFPQGNDSPYQTHIVWKDVQLLEKLLQDLGVLP